MRLTEGASILQSGGPGDREAERSEITDMIGRKPLTRTLREMNTPVVPERMLKEKARVTGSVRMKNVDSPNKSELIILLYYFALFSLHVCVCMLCACVCHLLA